MSASYSPAVEAELARLAGLSWDGFREEADDAADRLDLPLHELQSVVQQRRRTVTDALTPGPCRRGSSWSLPEKWKLN